MGKTAKEKKNIKNYKDLQYGGAKMELTLQERRIRRLKSIEELRAKYPEGQRSALMDDFLNGIFLTEVDKRLLKKLKKLGIVEEK